MKKQIRHNKKKSKIKNPNSLWTAKEKRVMISIGVVIFVLAIGFYGFMFKEEHAKTNAYKSFIGVVVPDSMVCMVSGEIKHKAINPIELEGKTYWGCCGQCETKLKYNTKNARMAKDPISEKLISKADAYIRINPENNRKVMFFESEANYNEYLKKNHQD